MESLFERFYQKLQYTDTSFTRSLMQQIHWEARLIGIRGARGVGKTTLLLQYIKLHLPQDNSTLYASLDNIWFSNHLLYELADNFVKKGGKYLFLDEVHKYPNWSQELKNIYDDFPTLHIVFTGSSLLEILNARADLSRRAIIYEMQGLSFREYLNFYQKTNFPIVSLEDIINKHVDLSREITSSIKPLQYFSDYLRNGYYPFYQELPPLYYQRIEEVINMTLEIELPLLRGVEISYIPKIKQLLKIIADAVPFSPNIAKLSERIGISRNALITYLNYLQEVHITNNLTRATSGIGVLQKPEKIYLDNTNLMFTLSSTQPNTGNARETFFLNQLSYLFTVNSSPESDFIVDNKYTFEIGGKNKTKKQISSLTDAYIAADEIEFGHDIKIPLWLFGFLY